MPNQPKPPTPEQRWDEVARLTGMTKRDLSQLAVQVFINEQNFKERIRQIMETEYQQKQLQLWSIQTENESMKERLLTFHLRRKLQWLDQWMKVIKAKNAVKGWFKRKPKPLTQTPLHRVPDATYPSAGTL